MSSAYIYIYIYNKKLTSPKIMNSSVSVRKKKAVKYSHWWEMRSQFTFLLLYYSEIETDFYIPHIFHFKCLCKVRDHLFQIITTRGFLLNFLSEPHVWKCCSLMPAQMKVILSLSTQLVIPIFFSDKHINDSMKWVQTPFWIFKIICSSIRRSPFRFVHCVSLYLVIRLDN